MFFFLWLIVVVVGIVMLYNGREHDEELLALKLVGYYLLGTFFISLNGLVLPIGFVICLLLRPNSNRSAKRGAAIFGLVLMLIGQFIF